MSITEKFLVDHAARKDSGGVTWFTLEDLHRLGIPEALFTAMQDVQHDLRLRHSDHVVESEGCTDRWSIQDTNAVRGDRLLASLAMSPQAPAAHAGNPHSQPGSNDDLLVVIPRLAPR